MDYCAAADLYAFGLPRGALPNPGRLVRSVDISTDAIELDVHGFALNEQISFRAESGGALPTPLVAGTTYYAIPLDEARFQVASIANGAAIDITVAGSRIVVLAPLKISDAIAWASRLIDDMLPAHIVPLTAPVPEIVRMTAAELAAAKALTLSGARAMSLGEMADAAGKRLERWAKGVPIRGDNAPPAANLAASASVPYNDARGWNRFGGIE